MIQTPMDILDAYPVRKSKKQKRDFLEDVQSYFCGLGYESRVEKGSLGAKNLVIGDPDRAEYLLTAHYDTCAWLPFPNLMTPCNLGAFLAYQLLVVLLVFGAAGVIYGILFHLTADGYFAYQLSYLLLWVFIVLMMVGPANRNNANDNTSGVVTVLEIAKTIPVDQRGKVCFVLFDLEEVGLIGSSSYQSRYKKSTKKQVVLNLDCVGDGDDLLLFPSGKLRKDEEKMAKLRGICGTWGKKSLTVREKGFSFFPSDQVHFPYGVGIAALNRSKGGVFYCGRIHTHKDTVLEETNVNILRASIICMITGSAAE